MKISAYTGTILPILSISLLCLSFNFTVKAGQEPLKKSLPLECSIIPVRNEYLCFIETQSPYGPYDDVVFYHMDKNGDLALLGSQAGEVATFGGIGFSTGGAFMWISWAEEGHPHFEFYHTAKFINNGINTKVLNVLGDYYFDGFEKFTDKGEVIYRLNDDAYEDCNKAGKDVSYKIEPKTSEEYCVKRFSLIAL